MTKYRTIDVGLIYDGKTVLATGTVEKEVGKDWVTVKEFSTSAELDKKMVSQIMEVVRSIAKKDFVTTQTFVEAKAVIEAEEIIFGD